MSKLEAAAAAAAATTTRTNVTGAKTMSFVPPGTKAGERLLLEILNVPMFVRILKAYCEVLPSRHNTESMVTFLPTGVQLTANIFSNSQSRRLHVVWLRKSFFGKYHVIEEGFKVIINLANLASELDALVKMQKGDKGGTTTIVDLPQNILQIVAKSSTDTQTETPIMTKQFTEEFLQTPAYRGTETVWIQPDRFQLRYPMMLVMETKVLYDMTQNLDPTGEITIEFDGATSTLSFHVPNTVGLIKTRRYPISPDQLIQNPFSKHQISVSGSQAKYAKSVLVLNKPNDCGTEKASDTIPFNALTDEKLRHVQEMSDIKSLSLRTTIPVEGMLSAVKDHHLTSFVQLFLGTTAINGNLKTKTQPVAIRHVFEGDAVSHLFPTQTKSTNYSTYYDDVSHYCTLIMPVRPLAVSGLFSSSSKGAASENAPMEKVADCDFEATQTKLAQLEETLSKQPGASAVSNQSEMNAYVHEAVKNAGVPTPALKKARGRPRKMPQM